MFSLVPVTVDRFPIWVSYLVVSLARGFVGLSARCMLMLEYPFWSSVDF